MIRIKIIFLFLLFSLTTLKVHSQEAKIKRAQEYIEKSEYSEAQAIFNKILEKNSDDVLALYFTELIKFKLGNVNKDLITRLNIIEQQYTGFSSAQKINDSVKFNVNPTTVAYLKQEITNKAFAQYYIKSNNLDSLKAFSIDYQSTESQTAHLSERICLLSFERLDLNNRSDLVSYINTNGECDQAKVVAQTLVRLDWTLTKEKNSIEDYNQFKIKHAKSELLDSANYFIHEINWTNAIKNDNVVTYRDFITTNPNSRHIEEAKSRYDNQLWASTKTSTDSIEIVNYISTCIICHHKDEAQNLLANIHWARVSGTSDTNALNAFISKWPHSDKVELAYSLKINLTSFIERISEIPATPIKYDITWEDRLAIYQKSSGQYLRTKVYPDGKIGIKERIVENFNSSTLVDVDEIITGDNKIIYSLINHKSSKSPKLISNYDGLVGLEINDFFLSQRFSNSFFAFTSGNEIYDAQKSEFIPVPMPSYNFSFNRPAVFPYLRIAYPDYLYSETFKSRGNTTYEPSLYNSDLIYSINQERFFCLNNSGLGYNVIFGSGQKLCLINDEIYQIENLEKVTVLNGLQNSNEENNKSYRKIHPKIVTFNDSMFVWYHAEDNILKIHRINSPVENTIDLSNLTRLQTSNGMAEFDAIEIDQFGRYLYVEWQPDKYQYLKASESGEENVERIWSDSFKSPSLLAIIDCRSSRIVYMGRKIGIDYTTEKAGWVMTKALYSYKNENIKIDKTRQEPVQKHGLSWNLTNYIAPVVSVDRYSFIEQKSLYTIDRSLINLNSLISDDFMSQLNNLVKTLSPVEDIFNQNIVKVRKDFIKDSLISVAHLWIKPSSSHFDSQLSSANFEPNYDKKVLNHCAKYSIDTEADVPSERFLQFIPKLTDMKREGDLFTFSFRIDSLPTELVESKMLVSDKYTSSIYNFSTNVGRVVQKELPYSLQDSNYITYFFDIVTSEEQFARIINDKIKINDVAVHFYADWSTSFLLESFEANLIEQYLSIEKMNRKNYWFDLINEAKSQGVSPWQISLQLVFISEDGEKWKLPILMKSEELRIKPLY